METEGPHLQTQRAERLSRYPLANADLIPPGLAWKTRTQVFRPGLASRHPVAPEKCSSKSILGPKPKEVPVCWVDAQPHLLPLLVYFGLRKDSQKGGGPWVWEALQADVGERPTQKQTQRESEILGDFSPRRLPQGGEGGSLEGGGVGLAKKKGVEMA